MYMYVNKRVELAQRGIALEKMYTLLFTNNCHTPLSTMCHLGTTGPGPNRPGTTVMVDWA